jgi:hypothetical protein
MQGVQDKGINIPTPVLLKLGEECAELSQAIFKCVNSGAGGYGRLEEVLSEAGHVKFFLDLVNTFSDGQVTKFRNLRVERHLESPKCTNQALSSYIFSQINDIYSWTEKESAEMNSQ